MIDLRVEVSIILSDLVKKLGLLIFYTFIVTMVGIIEVSKRFIRLYKDILININRVIHKAIVWVIHRLEHSLVLGQPFYKQAQLKLREMRGRGTKAIIYTPNNTGIVS